MPLKRACDEQFNDTVHFHKKQKQSISQDRGDDSRDWSPKDEPDMHAENPVGESLPGSTQAETTVAATVVVLANLWDRIEANRASMEEHAVFLGKENLNTLKELCQAAKAKSRPRSALDEQRPPTVVVEASVPPYDGSKPLKEPEELPPLPSIKTAELAEAPFIHASCRTAAQSLSDAMTYERLEFLGDAYLEIIASRLIFSRCPDLNTGQQSGLRQLLVKNETLAKFALQYGFDKRVKTGSKQDFEADATRRMKILADMFEAYVAALILSMPDSGFETAEAWLTELWTDILLGQRQERVWSDAKNQLAKTIHFHRTKIEYLEEKPSKFDKDTGNHLFTLGVYFTGWGYVRRLLGVGSGVNKTQAGMKAAKDALERNAALIDELGKRKDAHFKAKNA